jgi:AcrR family transcriptional regulator
MPGSQGRANQRLRTRKDLLEAALRLSSEGRSPTLEEIAEAAMVSRATAYRYFPSVEALLSEAAAHVAFPDLQSLFDGMDAGGPAERMKRLDQAISAMIAANEPTIRAMLATAVRQALADEDVPARQNRRSPAIEAALAPCRSEFEPKAFDRLQKALALVIGTESLLALKDVLRLDAGEATAVRHWAIEALVEKARAA